MELLFLLLLVGLMAAALASGFPVAFALPGSAILTIGLAAAAGGLFAGHPDAYFAQGGPMNWLTAGTTNLRGIYWEVERDTLIAIPLFVFMGIMLQRSKIAEDLLVAMAQLFGPIRGGLGISVVFVGALLAATTGIVGATVVAMGLISLPAMLRNNYSHSLATGTIAASGTLGQIIPPSIVLIILADQLASAVDQAGMSRTAYYKATTGNFALPSEFGVASTSAGDMFMGALLPGLVLVALYMIYILVASYLNPKLAPAVAYGGKYDRTFLIRVLLALLPPLTLIFLVLGSIITGIATVNQAGAIGAAGALVMAGYRLYEGPPGGVLPSDPGAGLGGRHPGGDQCVLGQCEGNSGQHRCPRHHLGRHRRVLFRDRPGVERIPHLEDRPDHAGCDDGDRQNHFVGVHHPARRGDVDRRLPRVRRRGIGARFSDRLAGWVLDAIHHRHGGDFRPRLLSRFHRNRRGGGADCRADPAIRPIGQRHRRVAGRDDRLEHPNLVPDPALRVRPVLPARGGAGDCAHGVDVQRCDPLHRLAIVGPGDRRRLPATGELPADPPVIDRRNLAAAEKSTPAALPRRLCLRAFRRRWCRPARPSRGGGGLGPRQIAEIPARFGRGRLETGDGQL